MSIQAVAWALEQDLPQGPKLVLVSLANHANHTDGFCWLKAETIGREASCSPRSVFRYVGGLVRNGYVRKAPKKGENGKQRANDYWLLFHREARDWDWGAQLGDDETAPDELEDAETEAQDVVEPTANLAHGETAEPTATSGTRQPVDTHAVSAGPCATAVTRYESLEPSKTNPKENRADAHVPPATPRAYRPPPPQPLGATVEGPTKQIFVYEGSRAYEAWAKTKAQQARTRNWHLTTRKFVNGQWRIGWYFPSLFPPDAPPPSGLTDEEVREFADTG